MIAVAIMHDERRAVLLDSLMQAINGQRAALSDPAGWSANIAVGIGTNEGPWAAMDSALRLALQANPGCSHVLLLEDDAILCHGFLESVARAVTSRPSDVLYFFATAEQAGHEMTLARAAGKAWVSLNRRTLPTLACVVPVADVDALLEWFDRPDVELTFRAILGRSDQPWLGVERAGDARLWAYLKSRGRGGMLSAWSLCEHGCPSPDDSLTGMRHAYHRIAHNPVWGLRPGDQAEAISASEIDWSAA